MRRPLSILKTLMGAGVEFGTDDQRLLWRNSKGRITPSVAAELAAGKAEILEFLNGKRPDLELSVDAKAYASALREHGPCGYGPIARILGWPMTRTGQAEAELRGAQRLDYGNTGRGTLLEKADDIG